MSVSFQTNTLKSRRRVEIDKHWYIVRRYGNIEKFEVLRLRDEMNSLIAKYPTDAAESDFKEADLKRIYEIANRISDMAVSLFDDGTKEQKHSRKLVSSLDDDEISELLDWVFNQKDVKEVNLPDEEKS